MSIALEVKVRDIATVIIGLVERVRVLEGKPASPNDGDLSVTQNEDLAKLHDNVMAAVAEVRQLSAAVFGDGDEIGDTTDALARRVAKLEDAGKAAAMIDDQLTSLQADIFTLKKRVTDGDKRSNKATRQ